MKKNDVVTVEVTDIGIGGEGIGKVDGYTLFIKDAVIGDTVEVKVMKAKKNYGYARLMRIVKESAFRVSARCPEARRCGGCQIQEMDYRKQLEFKNTKVRNNLIRLGSVEEELLDQIMEPIAGMEEPFRYRNKAQFPIGVDKEGNLIAGFVQSAWIALPAGIIMMLVFVTFMKFLQKKQTAVFSQKKEAE